METLNLDQLERSAETQLEIAKRAKELEALVSRAFPGYRVYIESRNGASKDAVTKQFSNLSHLPGVGQIETILRDARVPLTKGALLGAIQDRGGTMNMDTLTSYLSRYPQFANSGRGLWTLSEERMAEMTGAK